MNNKELYPMDPYKLQLIRERDNIWAEARDKLPLFEKFFNKETSDEFGRQICWVQFMNEHNIKTTESSF